MTTSRDLVAVRSLSVSFTRTAVLDDVSFAVAPGEFVAVIGPSGCGKSTLLRVLAGLVPDGAQVAAGEVRVPTDAHGRPASAWMPQGDSLLPWRRALPNALVGARIAGLERDAADARARALLSEFGLGGFERAWPHELSGGMRQRLALARTCLPGKPVLLLDEPFGALDALTRRRMNAWLASLSLAGSDGAVLLVTHDVDEALLLADRVLVLSERPAGSCSTSLYAVTRMRARSCSRHSGWTSRPCADRAPAPAPAGPSPVPVRRARVTRPEGGRRAVRVRAVWPALGVAAWRRGGGGAAWRGGSRRRAHVGGARDDAGMLLADVAATSTALAATRSRLQKRALLVDLLRGTGADDVEVVSRYLAGELRQRRTGLGWRSLTSLPEPASAPTLTVAEVDAAFEQMAKLEGPGSTAARLALAAALFGAATADEQALLRGLIAGELRQGALDALLLDAVAEASGVAPALVRRAAMLAGATEPVAVAALGAGNPERATAALSAFGLVVGRPVRPMLAQSAPDVAAAVASLGSGEVVVDTKLDGIRIQVHRSGDDVRVYTRSLDDITARVPEIVAAVRGLTATDIVLDGEALAVGPDGRPRPFQETASRTATHDAAAAVHLTPYFFDCLHVDGRDLLDAPLHERLAALDAVAGPYAIDRLVTADADAARARFDEVVRAGQEGVVVKALDAPYEAGRRGAAWVKVKPRHTLDLVVLAVEWGSGRRRGFLSNIHLGARSGEGFVMLGKTFKGMTDEMLAWQTERFQELETSRDDWVVTLRPEQVVEIAFDGLQRSSRYPGGVALRFARVLRYRDDKTASEADTIETVLALAER